MTQLRYSCVYVNRACPRHCEYCAERAAPLQGRELKVSEWKAAIAHLDSLGIKFHLVLGNDVLMLGDGLLDLIAFLKGRTDYAMYSTMEPTLFSKYKERLLPDLYNLSSGIDVLYGNDSIAEKSRDGLAGLAWLRFNGIRDCQGTITIGKNNLEQVEPVVNTLSKLGIHVGLNTMHWNKDGNFDFFPDKKHLKDYVLEDTVRLRQVIVRLREGLLSGEYLIQNPVEYLDSIPEHGTKMSWHCTNPLLVSVDADGSLRCCGYRPGTRLRKYSVFDLGTKLPLDKYDRLWKEDSAECPGCFWSYYYMIEHFTKKTPEFGDKVFQVHASEYRR